MNLHCELSSKKLIILHIFINIHSTFAQDSKTSNITHLHTTIKDSNVTWIKITTLNLAPTTSIPINYTSIENISIEDPNSDISGTARRKRRKRRRNKYRSWNQRRTSENSHKKHSTRVHLDKPVQFLIPPDYQENIISRETDVIKSRNSHENYNTVATPYKDKNIVPPARFLLPPYVDQYFLGNSVTGLDNKKTKNTEWTSNANRGSTKFKHTIYYSDSGNEILSHYNEISSTTPANIHTTEKRVFIQQRPDLSRVKPEYRPIVVQPTPVQYNTQAFINNSNYVTPNHKEKYMNSFVSNEVANAGMQVINMSAYQQSLQLLQQNQFLPVQKHKQYTETPILQQTSPRINYQQFQQIQSPVSNSALTYSNSQAEHLRYTQTYNHHYSQQNYQPTTVYSRPPDIRSTTPAVEFTTNRTTIAKVQTTTDNFKGLEIAESKYFSDIPSEQEFTALQNDQVIPGIAGRDYPVFGQTLLQKRRFACRGLEGYFADVNSRCQVFYICNGDGAGEPMLCPNGTLFSQELLVCDWWYNVDC